MVVVVAVAQSTWYHLTVAQDGKPVDVGHKLIGAPYCRTAMSSPSSRGDKVEFELIRFVPSVESLPPGKNAARFRFWVKPEKGEGVSYESPPAEFVVEK